MNVLTVDITWTSPNGVIGDLVCNINTNSLHYHDATNQWIEIANTSVNTSLSIPVPSGRLHIASEDDETIMW